MALLWWLSFCDPTRPKGEQFLGACIVRAASFPEALMVAGLRGCNPGGECEGSLLDRRGEAFVDEPDLNKLMTREECEQLDNRIMQGRKGAMN